MIKENSIKRNAEKATKNWAPNRAVCCFCGEVVAEFPDEFMNVELGHQPMFRHIQNECKEL